MPTSPIFTYNIVVVVIHTQPSTNEPFIFFFFFKFFQFSFQFKQTTATEAAARKKPNQTKPTLQQPTTSQ